MSQTPHTLKPSLQSKRSKFNLISTLTPKHSQAVCSKPYIPSCATSKEQSMHSFFDKFQVFAVNVKESIQEEMIKECAPSLKLSNALQNRKSVQSSLFQRRQSSFNTVVSKFAMSTDKLNISRFDSQSQKDQEQCDNFTESTSKNEQTPNGTIISQDRNFDKMDITKENLKNQDRKVSCLKLESNRENPACNNLTDSPGAYEDFFYDSDSLREEDQENDLNLCNRQAGNSQKLIFNDVAEYNQNCDFERAQTTFGSLWNNFKNKKSLKQAICIKVAYCQEEQNRLGSGKKINI